MNCAAHIISIVASLFYHLTSGNKSYNENYLRLLVKFTDENYAKLERIVELVEKSQKKLLNCEYKIQKEIDDFSLQFGDRRRTIRPTAEKEAEYLALRLECGLFDLRILSRIVIQLLLINFDDPIFAKIDVSSLDKFVLFLPAIFSSFFIYLFASENN